MARDRRGGMEIVNVVSGWCYRRTKISPCYPFVFVVFVDIRNPGSVFGGTENADREAVISQFIRCGESHTKTIVSIFTNVCLAYGMAAIRLALFWFASTCLLSAAISHAKRSHIHYIQEMRSRGCVLVEVRQLSFYHKILISNIFEIFCKQSAWTV